MKPYLVRVFVFALTALFFQAAEVKASSLFGRVVEINDADVITVFNLNRRVRVKLLCVHAPEASHAFGEVAKKHLSDLVFDKSVLVEYSGIAADSSLVGRVLLNDADIGAQMIRDGAAWFDPQNESRLSEADRKVYQQSEHAARAERRGLWQSENTVVPREFVKTETSGIDPVASLNSILPASKDKAGRPIPELTNGYTGSEFDLTSCTIPGKVRAFTRLAGDQRQMYIGVVFYKEEDPNVARFLRSFTVGSPAQKIRTHGQ